MKWFAEYSKVKARGYIIDETGFIVVGPFIASLSKAKDICHAHNQEIEVLRAMNRPLSEAEERLVSDMVS